MWSPSMALNFIGQRVHRALECLPCVITLAITLEICIIFTLATRAYFSSWNVHLPPSHLRSSHACLRQRFQSFGKIMSRLTVWKDEGKIISCSLYKCNWQTGTSRCVVSHNDTTESTCGNFSRCLFLYLSVNNYFLARSSSCFLWAFPACPPQIMTSASGKCSVIAFEEESASGQWMAMLMPSSFAFLKVRHAAYPAPLDVPWVPHLSKYLCLSGTDAFDKEELQCNNYEYWT